MVPEGSKKSVLLNTNRDSKNRFWDMRDFMQQAYLCAFERDYSRRDFLKLHIQLVKAGLTLSRQNHYALYQDDLLRSFISRHDHIAAHLAAASKGGKLQRQKNANVFKRAARICPNYKWADLRSGKYNHQAKLGCMSDMLIGWSEQAYLAAERTYENKRRFDDANVVTCHFIDGNSGIVVEDLHNQHLVKTSANYTDLNLLITKTHAWLLNADIPQTQAYAYSHILAEIIQTSIDKVDFLAKKQDGDTTWAIHYDQLWCELDNQAELHPQKAMPYIKEALMIAYDEIGSRSIKQLEAIHYKPYFDEDNALKTQILGMCERFRRPINIAYQAAQRAAQNREALFLDFP